MKKTEKKAIELSAELSEGMLFGRWWDEEGRYLDPDTSDVSWYDKRRGLAEYAFGRDK